MATPPRWTKTAFLSWFEQHRPKLIDLTAGLFGAELKACGFSAEDTVDDALVRSLCKRHYRSCRTTMRTWFLRDVGWIILDALRKAERTVLLLDADPEPESTSGDDMGRIEYAVASDEVDDIPAVWRGCDTLPPFIKSCTHRPEDATPGRDCPAYEWATYQLDLRHRAARRRSIYRQPSGTFWPEYRAAGDRLPVAGQQRDQRPWKQALRAELWRYRNRLEDLQVADADSESTISDGLARCSRRSPGRREPVLVLADY